VARLVDNLAALATMSPAQLRAEWRQVVRTPLPALPPDLLRRSIAYRLQERVHGGLAGTTCRALDRLAQQLARGETSGTGTPVLKPGVRLVRHWQDRTYSVLVADDGFLFDGARYASLSQIARTITGTPWSGPRFFGLRSTVGSPGPTGAAAASARRSRIARTSQTSGAA